ADGGAEGACVASYGATPTQIQETLREQTRDGTRWRDMVREPDGSWKTVRDAIQNYDPRPRPWYVAATASDHGVWVEPFLFTSRQHPGFIYSSKDVGRDGIQRGVWAVQFEVEYLSEFLSTLHLGNTGRVYVVSRSGLVVGHPAGEVTEVVDGVKQIARADNHRDPMLAGAWKE